mmetsp:Transcript_2177/g.7979  ORF Transcript_2177/g.7979 Transcript_2177/m.7979 type:complete len:83 (+) Transcript_2177:153-401(+)
MTVTITGTITKNVDANSLVAQMNQRGFSANAQIVGTSITIVTQKNVMPSIGNPQSPIDQSLAVLGSGWVNNNNVLDCSVTIG